MFKIKKILFGLDISHISNEAFDYAIHLADRNGAELSILYVCPNYRLRSVDVYFPENVMEEMKEMKEKARIEVMKLCEEKILKDTSWNLHIEVENTVNGALIAKT